MSIPQSAAAQTAATRPASGAIRLDPQGVPHIAAYRCRACGTAAGEAGLACRRCAARDALEPFEPARTGTLHTWSVVARSYPGVAVPFVSAIVDLDGGPTLKGTLRAAPETLRQGLPVSVVFDDAGGARDAEGAAYVGFHFEPAQTAGGAQ